MKYINKKTGAILDSPSSISGGDWTKYDEKDKEKEKSTEKVKNKEENTEDKSDMTKEEVMNELDALGIEYNKNAKKEDLIKLMMGD